MKIASKARNLVIVSFVTVLAGTALSVPAFASGYEFDGIGARSVARGGAVIADANDWTAIYWNPSGLVDLPGKEAGIDLRAGQLTSKDGNSYKVPGIPITFHKTKNTPSFILGSGGAALPLNERSALGFGVYVPLMQGVKFEDSDTNGLFDNFKTKGYAALAVANISYALKVNDRFSAGLGLDAIYAKLHATTTSGITSLFLLSPFLPAIPDTQSSDMDGQGYGLEGVLGLKYKPSETLSFGGVFRTGSHFDLKGDASFSSLSLPVLDEKSDFKMQFRHPATSGVGAAWKAGKDLKLTCDFTQTWWKGFSNKTTYDTPGTMLANSGNTYKWVNSVKFRAGALWNYGERTDFMFGYAFDTPAIDKNSIDFSTAIDVPMHRFSAAATRKFQSIDWTLGALAGGGSRTAGGVHYSVKGWYVMSEASYRF